MPKATDTMDPDWTLRRVVTDAEVLLGAEHSRERLSSVPFYANKAKRWQESEPHRVSRRPVGLSQTGMV